MRVLVPLLEFNLWSPTPKIIRFHAGNVVHRIACGRVGILLNLNERFRESLRATIYAKQRIDVED